MAIGEDRVERWAWAASAWLLVVAVVFGTFLVGIWFWVVLGVCQIVASPLNDPSLAFSAFALTLAMMCATLWLGKQISAVELDEAVAKQIWTALVVSVLVSVGMNVGNSLEKMVSRQHQPAVADQ